MIKLTKEIRQKTRQFLANGGQTAIDFLRQETPPSPALKDSQPHEFVYSDGYKQGYADALRDLDRKVAAEPIEEPRSAQIEETLEN